MFLRERNTAASVTEIFQYLRKQLGEKRFSILLQVILTNHRNEFTNPMKIDTDTETRKIQCRVFYCDPMNSNQKNNCEFNYELIRYVIPKKQTKGYYMEGEIREM